MEGEVERGWRRGLEGKKWKERERNKMEWKRSEEEGKERKSMKKRNRRKFPGG